MRFFPSFALTFLLIFCEATSLKAHVILDYPQGGETFLQGQVIVIQWHVYIPHPQLNWDLYYSQDGGVNWIPIALDLPLDTLTHHWTVPFIETTQARIRVIQDNIDQDYLDFSMNFTIVADMSPPVVDVPASNVTVPCGANTEALIQAWLDNHGDASVTNHCGNLIWQNDYSGIGPGCGNTGDAYVTFTASDECGSTETIALLNVVDQSPPVFSTLPQNATVECNGYGHDAQLNPWISHHGYAEASDACGGVSWSAIFREVNNRCDETGTYLVTFRATDACGNSADADATFTITDTHPPVINVTAQDTVINCSENQVTTIQQWLSGAGGADAEDLCGDVHWTNNYTGLIPDCGNTGHATIIFSAADDCGNFSTTEATMTIVDHTSPVIQEGASDTTFYCDDPELVWNVQAWIDSLGGAHAEDMCGTLQWTVSSINMPFPCEDEVSLVNFTAKDACGNEAVTQAHLTVLDTTIVEEDSIVFAPLGATWYYVQSADYSHSQPSPFYFLFLVEKDTTILGREAREIGCYLNIHGTLVRQDSFSQFVSVDGQKIYYFVDGDFILLYDFSAGPGDTIHSKVAPFPLDVGCSTADSVLEFRYVIDSVSVVNVEGHELKVQYVSAIMDNPDFLWGFHDGDPIYERFGYAGGGSYWWGAMHSGCILEAGGLRCYADNEISWPDPPDPGSICDYLSVTDEKKENIKLYPNPSSGIIYLPDHADNVTVYGLDGRKVLLTYYRNEIDLSSNPSGMYIVQFSLEGHVYLNRVVLK